MSETHENRPTHRFSRRVADYVRYRPSYPRELIGWLQQAAGFAPSWKVADVGSGTGIFTRLFLDNGNRVYAVEPNDAMRAEADTAYGDHPHFISIKGTAEATTLPDRAVELVTAAQAFHWFEPEATRREFERVVAPGGWVLIAFNSRRHDASPFMRDYEALLRGDAVDYRSVDHTLVFDRLRDFLGEHLEWRKHFSVVHTRDAMRGLTASSSYAPAPGHPAHDEFYRALRALIETHQVNGNVELLYETEAFLARLGD